jgi:lysophospholipase L1-like esterase
LFKTLQLRWGFILSRFLILATLAISLGFNRYLFSLATEYHRQIRELRRDPYGLEIPMIEAPPLAAGQKRILFFGDSRAQDWPPPDGFQNFQFVNRAMGGQTSIQVLGRFEPHVVPLRPDLLILQVGINDLTSIPVFPQDKDRLIADCLANIQHVVDQAADMGTTVILTTIFPVAEPPLERRLFSWSDDISTSIVAVNERLRTMSSAEVLVLDAYAVLVGDQGLIRPEYAADTLHLNWEGYAALNRELSNLFKELE